MGIISITEHLYYHKVFKTFEKMEADRLGHRPHIDSFFHRDFAKWLKDYHCCVLDWGTNMSFLVFESEEDKTMFLLRWT